MLRTSLTKKFYQQTGGFNMAVFQAYSPRVEVNGQTVLAVVNGMGAMKTMALKILAEADIVNPKPNQWYSQQKWLDAFKVIAEEIGPMTLFKIGNSIPKNADFPSGVKDIHVALQAIDVAYKSNHRGGEIGYYKYIKIGEHRVMMECKNPYPSDFDRGIIVAMAREFAPVRTLPSVSLDITRPSRKTGGESCTFVISW
jgi:hypothetical protein